MLMLHMSIGIIMVIRSTQRMGRLLSCFLMTLYIL